MRGRLHSLLMGLVVACGTIPGPRSHGVDADLSGNDPRTVRFDGFGRIKIGMSVAEASTVAGLELNDEHPGYSREPCDYVSNPELSGIAFMVVEEKIARIDVSDSRYRTEAGARVGMTEAELIKLYPHITLTPNTYHDEWHDLKVESPDGGFALVFVTDGKNVMSYRSGLWDPVSWIEGCL